MKFDAEEKEILKYFEKAKLETNEEDIAHYQEYARDTLRKDKRISIRISSRDLEGIQKRAIREGLPYQSLISSIIHKYVAGSLVEKPE